MVLEVANSLFLGDYLTSEGQAGAADLAMIADAGFEVVGRAASEAETCTGDHHALASVLDASGIALRRRGAGTSVPANV